MQVNYETIKSLDDRVSNLEALFQQLVEELRDKKLLPKAEEPKK